MDNHVITCDVDFGSAGPVFADKGTEGFRSPGHESDSGCSDMSGDRSVSPDVDVTSSFDMPMDRSVSPDLDIVEIGFPELGELSTDALTNDLDEELKSYLHTPLKVSERTERPAVTTVLPLSPEMDSDSDLDYEPPKLRKQDRRPVVHTQCKSKYVSTPPHKTDICVLPSSSTGQKASTKDANKSNERPAVKVVKVIKTPAAASNEELGSQLMQALEERNQKNAKQAKINREKKKTYIKNMEDEIECLKTENFVLKEQQKNFASEKRALQDEVDYLKSVLANQSVLSGLLQNIGNVKGVKLSSSLTRKRHADLDHDYQTTGKRRKSGMCLHVDGGNVSLEFCSKCSKMAKSVECVDESPSNSSNS